MIHWLPNDAGFVLHERAATFVGTGSGWLSVKSFAGGQALYQVERARYAVADAAYLVLNHGQHYTVTIDADQPVESFCVFFAPSLVQSVDHSLHTPLAQALDGGCASAAALSEFVAQTYPHDGAVWPVLQRMRQACTHQLASPAWLLEGAHHLITALLQVHAGVCADIERLPAVRASTRAEVYRRLAIARDYMQACFAMPLTLHDIADVAGFSPNHLLRTFKQAFNCTPHQFLMTCRLQHAQHLLRHTKSPVTDICSAIGFVSPSTFSWLFRQRYGLSPRQYREQL